MAVLVNHMLRVLLFAASMGLLCADMYDVVMPSYLPPVGCAACKQWADVGTLVAEGLSLPDDWGNSCVMIASNINGADKTPEDAFRGPFCYCNSTGKAGTCLAPLLTPEQLNLQMAEPSVVVCRCPLRVL